MLSSILQNTFKYQERNKTFTVAHFTASWENDGMEISCRDQFNMDPYLIQKMTLRVEREFRNTERILMYWFHLVVLFVPLGDDDLFFLIKDKRFFSFFLLDR